MTYQTSVIRKEQCVTSRWSGGTTTQLGIYPPEAVYSERNFLWRLSSAVVELEESDFTPLPGFERIIMILDGKMQLEHLDHHSIELKPFEQDSFSGSWQTKSRGRVTDFNLIYSPLCRGKVTAHHLKADETVDVSIENSREDKLSATNAFYLINGSIRITLDNRTMKLEAGDLLLISTHNGDDSLILSIQADNSTVDIIQAEILIIQ